MSEPLAPEHVTEVGSDSEIQAASWSCSCGESEVITYARPGLGEVVALRLARIKAGQHEQQDGGEAQ
jgi:hypothetical protein